MTDIFEGLNAKMQELSRKIASLDQTLKANEILMEQCAAQRDRFKAALEQIVHVSENEFIDNVEDKVVEIARRALAGGLHS